MIYPCWIKTHRHFNRLTAQACITHTQPGLPIVKTLMGCTCIPVHLHLACPLHGPKWKPLDTGSTAS